MTPVLVVITVIMIILMTGVALVSVIMEKANTNDINRGFRNLSIFLLFHMLLSFLYYYFANNFISGGLLKVLGVSSDLVYFGYVAAWLNITAILTACSSHRQIIDMKIINRIIFFCAVAEESVFLILGKYAQGQSGMRFEYEAVRTGVTVFNILFAAAVIAAAAAFLFCTVRAKDKGMYRSGGIFFSAMMILYMIWILVYDFASINRVNNEFLYSIIIDPIFIICSVIDIGILIFFFKRFPFERMETQEPEKTREQLIEEFAAAKGLTNREKEVLAYVLDGFNNSEMAKELFISENTVKRHMNNIFRKSEARNRYDLISKVLG